MNRVVKESGDFTAEFRLVGISAIAVVIGAVCAVLALVLLRLIELFTNLFYFQEWSFRLHLPASSTLGWLAVLVPVVGGLIVGLMAR
jgi:chloride channel protein, CIC family